MVDVTKMNTSRAAAKVAGDRYYFTGKPCKHGHVDYRYTDSGSCHTCRSDIDKRHHWKHRDARLSKMAKWELANKDKRRESARIWRSTNAARLKESEKIRYANNMERYRERRKTYYENNREALLAKSRERRIANKERYSKAQDLWRDKNRLRTRALSKMRKAHIKLATPKWADTSTIYAIYLLRPIGYEVDHIVPLRAMGMVGKKRVRLASGLHVPKNLQYLTKAANSTKTNNWSGSGSFDSNAIVPFSWEHFLAISEQA